MGNLRKRLGKNLKRIRGPATQVEFAKKLGISKSSLNRIEIGEQNVALDTLQTLMERLKLKVGDLLDLE